MSCFLLKIEQFRFPSFHRAWHQEDGCHRAFPYLKNDSSGDFYHSKQFKFEEKCLSKHSKIHEGKQTSFLAKVNSRCFFLFLAAMFVPLRGTQTWCLHTKLYKIMWNILSNNSSTECRTDLTLGQMPYLYILYTMSISWLHSWNGFDFLFNGVTVKTENWIFIWFLLECVICSKSLLHIEYYEDLYTLYVKDFLREKMN